MKIAQNIYSVPLFYDIIKEKVVLIMSKRYELTNQEWEKISYLFPPEKTNEPGRPRKNNRLMLNAMIWIAKSGAPWRDMPECYGPWKSVYSRFRNWLSKSILKEIFKKLSLEAELSEISIDASIVQAHQHSAGARKNGPPNEIGHSRGGNSTKIHAVVEAYGYPISIMISEGQRSDVKYAIPILENLDITGSDVLADRGYDCWELIDYIYENGGEPSIPSKKGAKFQRRCDWFQFKERHLVEKYFLKLKSFRHIATRYDKLALTYLGFIFLASILIWLK